MTVTVEKSGPNTNFWGISTVFITTTIFNCINILQIKEHAMGTKCSPTYAIIFKGIFEEIHIYWLIKQKVQWYLIHKWHIFHMGTFWKWPTTVYIKIQWGTTLPLVWFQLFKNRIHFLDIIKNIYRKTFDNTIQKRYWPVMLSSSKIRSWNEVSPIRMRWD